MKHTLQDKVAMNQELYNKVLAGINDLIILCGENPERNGLIETPSRVIKAFLEYTSGYKEDPKQHLNKTFDIEQKELVIVKDIEFYSLCEHHFAPFYGVAHIGYIPSENITGLSKIARMVDCYSKRFQVQERLTVNIIDAMSDILKPKGVMVVIEAKHMCMCGRGVKKTNASTTTIVARGSFETSSSLRSEFLSLIK